MRPKKRVLLIEANEEKRGLMRFVLETHGYRVMPAESAEMALGMHETVDCVLGWWPLNTQAADHVARRSRAGLIIVVPQSDQIPAGALAHIVLTKQMATHGHILEWLKTACARKRGPHGESKLAVSAAAKAVAA